MKKLIAFALCVVLLLGISVPAFAAETAAVDYCRVKIVVDGATLCPKDAEGRPVEPFIWNGTTYLPVRSVANTLGLEVGWEPGTVKLTSGAARTAAVGKPIESQRARTISVGGQDTKVTLDGAELSLKDAAGNPVTPIISGGTTYLPVRAIADALDVPVLWDGETATVYLGKAIEWKVGKKVSHLGTFGGAETTYTYDAQGRLLTEKGSFQDDEGNREVVTGTYTYDEHGWLLRHTYTEDFVGSASYADETSYTYDENGKVLTETNIHKDSELDYRNYDTTYTYNFPDGADLSIDVPEGIMPYINLREYDANGNLTRLAEYHSGRMYVEFLYTYDGRGNLLSETEKRSWGETDTVTYTYDEQDRMVMMEESSDGVLAVQYEYTYDDRGNVASERETYFYEDDESSERITRYTYDEAGNCVKMEESGRPSAVTIYEYNAGNQVVKVYYHNRLDTENTYDQYGNLIKTVEPGYHYDSKRYELVANGDDRTTIYTYTPIYK